MRPEELMIGDLVKVDGINYRISELGTTFTSLDNEKLVLTEQLQPVQITPKILKEYGFVWCSWMSRYVSDICNLIKIDKNTYHVSSTTINIRYAHELQHLFKLGGLYKEVES